MFWILIAAALGLVAGILPAQAQGPRVRAVLFHSPSCGHCHVVMTKHLPPLLEEHGDQLQILYVDVTVEEGQKLYRSAVADLRIGPDRQGVPTMVVGREVLVGSVEIPDRLPGLIESGLAGGGLDWPQIPGLSVALADVGEPSAPDSPPAQAPDVLDRLARDPAGNGLAIVVIGGILVALSVGVSRLRMRGAGGSARQERRTGGSAWLGPLLLVGLVAASYLTAVELIGAEAICGPVGDCHAVQASRYARLLGVPIAGLGTLAYLGMSAAWALGRWAAPPLRDYGWVSLASMACAGTLFSLYLTILEPFVIGATCMWCLTSASAMALIFVLSAASGRSAFVRRLGTR